MSIPNLLVASSLQTAILMGMVGGFAGTRETGRDERKLVHFQKGYVAGLSNIWLFAQCLYILDRSK
jgi:hypothetical protein